jgi:hypothetical protein
MRVNTEIIVFYAPVSPLPAGGRIIALRRRIVPAALLNPSVCAAGGVLTGGQIPARSYRFVATWLGALICRLRDPHSTADQLRRSDCALLP